MDKAVIDKLLQSKYVEEIDGHKTLRIPSQSLIKYEIANNLPKGEVFKNMSEEEIAQVIRNCAYIDIVLD